MKWYRKTILGGLLAVAATAAAGFVGAVSMAHDWTTASRASAGLAPDPAPTREAVVQVYIGRAWGWRGRFGGHSWIAVKPTDAPVVSQFEILL